VKIEGKLVLITGASSGIGAATAREMAQKGASVVLLARSGDALQAVASAIRSRGGSAYIYPVDIGDPDKVRDTVGRVIAEHGTPDVVVHSAGAGRWLFVDETTPEEAVQMMTVPYFGAFYVTRAVLPGMIARGSGHFVTIGSPATLLMWPGAAGYIAARWALAGFTEALRTEVHDLGIDVTLIVPGQVDTGYFAHNPGARERVPKIMYALCPVLAPGNVAASVIRGVEKRKWKIVTPFGLRVLAAAHTLFPPIGSRIARLTGARRSARTLHEEDSCLCSR
jgi:short-subunit dehydrogenase